MLYTSDLKPCVLARAATVSDVAELNAWQDSDLMALAEADITAYVKQFCPGATIRNRYIDSKRTADGSPHFTADDAQGSTALYVLCISSPDSVAALTSAQYAWAESHPASDVVVIPCVVQHLRADYARCTAMPPILVRRSGLWQQDEECTQFLPLPHRSSRWLGGAYLLKWHNLVREVANGGVRIYPYIEGLVTHRQLLPGRRLLASNDGACPLILVQMEGAQDGALRVIRADFYSSENAVNELEVYDVPESGIELISAGGQIYRAACAELTMFPGKLRRGLHLRWSVSLVADSFAFTTESKLSVSSVTGNAASLVGKVEAAKPIQFSGMPGYSLSVRVSSDVPELLFNVYLFAHQLEGHIPAAGMYVSAQGNLVAAPDVVVDSDECWADMPPTPVPLPELPEPTDCANSLPDAVRRAFIQAGYREAEPFVPHFRFGRPDFHWLTPEGKHLLVMVDSLIDEQVDQWGYRCRFYPDRYPTFIRQSPQVSQPSDLGFITLEIKKAEDEQAPSITIHQHGASLPSLQLPTIRNHQIDSEREACELFADCLLTQSFERILPFLSAHVHYVSETAHLELFSQFDCLRYLRCCFDQWHKRKEWPNINVQCTELEYGGVRRPTVLVHHYGELISATVITLHQGCVAEIRVLPPSAVTAARS